MDIVNLVISLLSGAVGGNVAGAALPEKNLGAIANTIAGLVGGGLGDFILKAAGILATTSTAAAGGGAEHLDLTSILGTIAASGVSGGALTAIIAFIKDALQKK